MKRETLDTCHELNYVLVCLKKYKMYTVWVLGFKLLLKVATSMLILAKNIDLPLTLFDFYIGKARNICLDGQQSG